MKFSIPVFEISTHIESQVWVSMHLYLKPCSEWGQEDHEGHHSSRFSERLCLMEQDRKYITDFEIVMIHRTSEPGEKKMHFRNRKYCSLREYIAMFLLTGRITFIHVVPLTQAQCL